MKINALTVCKSLYKCLDKQYSVKNKKFFIGLIPFQSIYVLLLQMSKCRKCFKEKKRKKWFWWIKRNNKWNMDVI